MYLFVQALMKACPAALVAQEASKVAQEASVVMMSLEVALGAMTLHTASEVVTSQEKLMPEMILVPS